MKGVLESRDWAGDRLKWYSEQTFISQNICQNGQKSHLMNRTPRSNRSAEGGAKSLKFSHCTERNIRNVFPIRTTFPICELQCAHWGTTEFIKL